MTQPRSEPPVLLSIAEGVAELRFNRPDQMNALDVATALAFRDGVRQAVSDPSVRAIILSGAGRAFLAGGDLRHFRRAADRAQAARALIQPIHDGVLELVESRIPTLAAVQGAVAGAGVSLALIADMAIAADNARFVMAYINIAASPDCGGSWALPRLVGHRKAAQIALLSEPVSAQEALRLGLVNWVVPAEELDKTARSVADRIAAGPARAMRATRALLDRADASPLKAHLEAELDAFVSAAASADFDEALSAFFEKRRPQFRSR
ncbi:MULTISPECIES: enoyl-CoA hydratase/isomerase family protein [unclassified Phenylobacterium]|uniref:enoyl-CoA hydratase/isomerase family protein n=1 Tax=unclassified Phenylobacterium TaxID=2640670 RepID=UPI00083B914C|nr:MULTISPECIES: enoyl-CoA hydratase-related protein [unclassified Phenylobacterium]